jgi:hypothetical protein
MRSSRGRSNRKAYAHNQQHNNKHNSKHNNKQNTKHNNKNNKHHHRHHGRYGWGDGSDDDGGDSDGGSDGASAAMDSMPVPAPITILNPAETGRPVNYTLGSADYSIEPSHSLAHNDGTQVITFERGASLGRAAYTLQPGTYRFVMTNTGWDLRTATDQLAANSAASAE